MKKLISIVVPCFNEQEVLPYFYEEIKKIAQKMNKNNFEFIFINDGSNDNTINVIKNYASQDKRVKYVSFSRNFGKEAAIYAGLKSTTGDYVVIMDADLQDPPELIPKMYEYVTKEDYDMVATRRTNRKGEPLIRSFFARKFYKIINKMSKTEMVDGARDYRFMKREAVDAILSIKEYNRYSKGLFSFVGFNTKWLSYPNKKRVAGKTKWSFWNLFIYAIDGITAFSTVPLVISALIGMIFCIISFLMILIIIIKTLIYGDPVSGWPSLVCIVFFVSGIQLFCIGIIGQYLSKTYLEVKDRPLYIIKEDNITKKH
jgi:glucosyltransferase